MTNMDFLAPKGDPSLPTRLKTYPKISLFKMPDPPPEIGVFGWGFTIVNNFFVLRDMDILSKQKMFKINHSFDS